MIASYEKLGAGEYVPHVVNVVVEIPKGKRNKYEICKDTGLVKLDRYLFSASHYPGEYGFIPNTLAEDGDPLDALVMVNEPTFPGCVIEARPIGIFKMTDKGDNDFKVLCVPSSDPIFSEYDNIWRVPPHFLREVEHFFKTYKDLEGGKVEVFGWEQAEVAHAEVLHCIEFYKQHKKNNPTES